MNDSKQELRAPDPTLTAWCDSGEHASGVVSLTITAYPNVAHKLDTSLSGQQVVCGRRSSALMATNYARWFAVPCGECFPEAGPPGYSLQDDSCGDGCGYRSWQPDEHLAWQVREQEQAVVPAR